MMFILVYILFEWFKSDSGERYTLGYFMSLLPSAVFFFEINCFKNISFRSTSRVSNSLDPDNA